MKETTNEQQVIKLTNDFYNEMYSFKNMPLYLRILFIALVMLSILLILNSFNVLVGSEERSKFQEAFLLFWIVSAVGIFGLFARLNQNYIIVNYNKKKKRICNDINTVRKEWVDERLQGKDYYFFAKQIIEWKNLKDAHSNGIKFNWRKLTYDSGGKIRVVALLVVFLSISAAVAIKFSTSVSLDDFLIQLAKKFNLYGFSLTFCNTCFLSCDLLLQDDYFTI